MKTQRTVQLTCYRLLPNSELESTPYLGKTFGKSLKAMGRALLLFSHLYGRSKKNGFVELSSIKMAKKFGCRRSWARLVESLVAGGWIEKERSFRPKESKRGAKCQGYRLTSKALELEWIGEKKTKTINTRSDGELRGVTIDKERALEVLAASNLPDHSQASFRREIELFTAQYSLGKQTGRLFTSANRLNEQLRATILINGNQVCELDVKNCQPLLMATLYPEQTEEAVRFRIFVESGKFYESIAEFAGFTRKKAKTKFTVWLGGGVNDTISHYFEKCWPELAAICSEIRKNKVALCHDLQIKESRVIVDEFPKRFGKTSISIHDGILIPEFERIRAEKILIEIFLDLYGLKPIVSSKHPTYLLD